MSCNWVKLKRSKITKLELWRLTPYRIPLSDVRSKDTNGKMLDKRLGIELLVDTKHISTCRDNSFESFGLLEQSRFDIDQLRFQKRFDFVLDFEEVVFSLSA